MRVTWKVFSPPVMQLPVPLVWFSKVLLEVPHTRISWLPQTEKSHMGETDVLREMFQRLPLSHVHEIVHAFFYFQGTSDALSTHPGQGHRPLPGCCVTIPPRDATKASVSFPLGVKNNCRGVQVASSPLLQLSPIPIPEHRENWFVIDRRKISHCYKSNCFCHSFWVTLDFIPGYFLVKLGENQGLGE